MRSPLPAGNVVDSSLSSLSSPWGGPAGGRGGLVGVGGLGGGGRGHFIHPAMYCTSTWCFALKGLRHNKQTCKCSFKGTSLTLLSLLCWSKVSFCFPRLIHGVCSHVISGGSFCSKEVTSTRLVPSIRPRWGVFTHDIGRTRHLERSFFEIKSSTKSVVGWHNVWMGTIGISSESETQLEID